MEGLTSLHTLNLSCNEIQVVSGLTQLRYGSANHFRCLGFSYSVADRGESKSSVSLIPRKCNIEGVRICPLSGQMSDFMLDVIINP